MTADRIVIVGNGRMTQACAAILRDRLPGRLRLIVGEARPGPAQSRLARFCARNDIAAVFDAGPINEPAAIERIAAAHPDLLLSIDNFQIFGNKLLALPTRGSVNFHNGLLDRYRGVNAPSWALFNGETEHGVSWHTMEPTIDAGTVLASARFPIREDATALVLTLECVRLGIELFETHLERLLDPTSVATTGDRRGARRGRLYTRTDLPNGGYLDLRWPYATIDRMLRATDFRPYPNLFTYSKLGVAGGELIVNAARALDEGASDRPGRILVAGDRLVTVCADRNIELTAVMLEPDRESTVAEAVEALGLAPGDRFVVAD